VAQNTAVHILDDLNGEPAEETVRFALDGVEYDIDLSAENAENLRQVLSAYVEHGRRTGGRKRAIRAIAQPKSARRAKKMALRNTAAKKPLKAQPAGKRSAAKTAAPAKVNTAAPAAKSPAPKTTAAKARATRSGAKVANKPRAKTAVKSTANATLKAAPTAPVRKTTTAKSPTKKAVEGKVAAGKKEPKTTSPAAKKVTQAKSSQTTAKSPQTTTEAAKPIRKAPPVTFSAATMTN
jgi:DNA-binding protein HU-beta